MSENRLVREEKGDGPDLHRSEHYPSRETHINHHGPDLPPNFHVKYTTASTILNITLFRVDNSFEILGISISTE